MTANGRVPPHDLDAEASVIGSLLLDPLAVSRVLGLSLKSEHFYHEKHGKVFEAAVALFQGGEPVDRTTLTAKLEEKGVLERVGGRAELARLQEETPTAANVEHYAGIVKDRALKRQVTKVGGEIVHFGQTDALTGEEAANQAQAAAFDLANGHRAGGPELLHDLLRPAMDRIDAQMANGGSVVGIASGFPDLDRVTNGWKPSDLVVIAGRPSMGKTSLAVQAALEAALEQHKPAVIFSLEMSKEQLVERMLCQLARIDAQRLHRGIVSEVEYERLADSLGPLGDAPIWIDDTPVMTDLDLWVKARQARATHGVEMVVLDYLQLMHSAHKGDEGEVQATSAISRSLKAVARELKVPVLALSQLSRAPESRPDKRPILSDLRASGSIEQDADVVLFLYRDEYYNRDTDRPGIAEVIVAKHRSGPTGTVELVFRKELTRFENLERRQLGEGDG